MISKNIKNSILLSIAFCALVSNLSWAINLSESFERINLELIQKPYNRQLHEDWYKLSLKNDAKELSKFDLVKSLIDQHPKDSLLNQDYITLLSWNNFHQKAVEEYQKTSFSEPQIFMLRSVAQSSRIAKEYLLSEKLYMELLSINPNDEDANLGLMITFNNNNQAEKALRHYQTLTEEMAQSKEFQIVRARSYQALNKQPKAVSIFKQELNKDKNDDGLYIAATMAVLNSGAVKPAYQMFNKKPDVFNLPQKTEILSAYSTLNIRLAVQVSGHKEKIKATEYALETNQKYLDLLEKNKGKNNRLIVSAQSDRMVLLSNVNRHDEVLNFYGAINDQRLPLYGVKVVAGSFLALQKSDQALEMIQPYLSENQNDFELMVLAYFSNLETEKYDEAYKYLDDLYNKTHAWHFSKNKKRKLPNHRKSSLELMKYLHIAYKNQIHNSLPLLKEFQNRAPANQEIMLNIAKLLRWKGDVESSVAITNRVNIIDPEQENVVTEEFHQNMALNQFKDAEMKMSLLKNKYSLSDSLVEINKIWETHNSHTINFDYSQSDNEGSRFSNEEDFWRMSYQSKPIKNYWRIGLSKSDKSATIQNNKIEYKQSQIGLTYLKERVSLNLFNVQTDNLSSSDWSFNSAYRLNSKWTFGLGYLTLTDQLPLRAFATNALAKEYKASISYRQDHRKSYSANTSLIKFTDNNQRKQVGLNASQQLFRDEHHMWTLSENYFLQKNSIPNSQAYFNPESYQSFTFGLNYQGIIHRRYQQYWQHELQLNAGVSKQNELSEHALGRIEYKHLYQWSRKFHIYAGLGYGLNHYDLEQEKGIQFSMGLKVQF